MRARIGLVVFLASAIALPACGREVTSSAGDTQGPSSAASSGAGAATQSYILDFSGCLAGSVNFGGRNNVAFSIETTQATRVYAFQAEAQVAPDFNSLFDYGSCPIDAHSGLIAKDVGMITTGDEAEVVSVDLDITGDEGPGGGICFGYRAKGQWNWDTNVATISFDTAGGGKVLHLPINHGNIDALYLATSAGSLAIEKITYTVSSH